MTTTRGAEAVSGEVSGLGRTGAAARVADALRDRITDGELPPGTRLSEEGLGVAMGVSRNTLREAFRLLTHERLLRHELHRGVFVPRLGEPDVVDLYRLRRAVECDVVRGVERLGPDEERVLRADVEAGELAASAGDWRGVGTANMRFHAHLVSLAGSRRADDVMARLLAELRLLFHAIDSARQLHEPYIRRNRELLELFVAAGGQAAAEALQVYLQDSERSLVAAFRAAGD